MPHGALQGNEPPDIGNALHGVPWHEFAALICIHDKQTGRALKFPAMPCLPCAQQMDLDLSHHFCILDKIPLSS